MRTIAQLLLTFLLNASWQVALIAAFAALSDWLLRGAAARYRHSLWVCALLLSLCIPALSCLYLIKPLLILKQSTPEVTSRPIVVTRIISPDVEPIETPVSETRIPVAPVRRNFWMAPLRIDRRLTTVLVALYTLFLLYRGTNLFRAWRRTRAIVSSAYEFQFLEPAQTIIQKCQSCIGIGRVRILCSALVPVPITVGIINPLVILPERLLQEVDVDLLTSAVGHELVHVARRDYLVNLIYEFIYLPLSFHPAVALVRRRIKQTRELCCDESVATKLLRPEVYARSLVRLIGSAPITRRLAVNTTIGIAESDNLEVRIMSLLRTPKLTPRRKTLLLVAASLLLAAPVMAASSLALRINIESDGVVRTQNSDDGTQIVMPALPNDSPAATLAAWLKKPGDMVEIGDVIARVDTGKELVDLQVSNSGRLERLLVQVGEKATTGNVIAIIQQPSKSDEQKLKEAQEVLKQKEEITAQKEKIRPEKEARMRELQEQLAQIEKNRPADEAQLKEAREKIAEMERLYTAEREREVQKSIAEMQKSETDRKAKLIYKVEPEYPEDARAKKIEGSVLLGLTIDHDGNPQGIQVKRSLDPSLDKAAVEAIRKWRFLPAMKDGQPVSMWITAEVYFGLENKRTDQEQKERELVERAKAQDREKEESEVKTKNIVDGQVVETRRSKERAEQGREERARIQAALTRDATISMDRAVQIATSQFPGKVLACSLGRDGDKVFYHLVIINTEGDKSRATYVWLSATDGQILKTEKEKE